MREALIGLVGLLIGVLLTEYYRRRSRIENYSARVFDRRLDAYEGLLKRIQASATTVRDLVEDASLTAEQKHKIAYEVGLEVMEYCDQHELFLDEEITVHVGAAFVGVADILEAEQQQDKEAALNDSIEM